MNGQYAGDVTVQQAWDLLQSDARTVLVDVRTEPEWAFVGVPALTGIGKNLVRVCWNVFPSMQVNGSFAQDVAQHGVEPDDKILMLCRSGVRSMSSAAAMTAAGYQNCYNVLGGFEGPHDDQRHRGTTDGWKAAGLPWEQS
ncbi:rhodanese-like domain-containing protein [Pelagibius sp. Alg239-R121]|uniref:rhodanese-like domain-containing protein n=1 Tax=Pelagibius sp. Alg239-R121 TaxID=2993448 RepID=UPI0024A6F95F|nr:rhodanese-like domain-containing protein [Pelagibius sp. Alg239-R121]